MLTNKMFHVYTQSLLEADKSRLRFRHGCIATYGGKIIAKGCNTAKYDKNTCTCHAEINVLHRLYKNYCRKSQKNKILKILHKTTLYISRLTQAGLSNDSAPCIDCLNIINLYKIKKIIFCMDNNYYSINPTTYINAKTSEGHDFVNSILNKN